MQPGQTKLYVLALDFDMESILEQVHSRSREIELHADTTMTHYYNVMDIGCGARQKCIYGIQSLDTRSIPKVWAYHC